MPRRADKKRTTKRALIAQIKEARAMDEETRRTAPRIIEEQILLELPPLLRVKPSNENRREKIIERKDSTSPEDLLHIFPSELDRDLDWSPDVFDREYFRLWEEENQERWERTKEIRIGKFERLFGGASETEREKEEMERDKKERMQRERKAEKIRLFGEITDSEEEEEKMEIEEEKMEMGEEKMEVGEESEGREMERESEGMDWESDIIIIEEEGRIDRLEREVQEEIERRDTVERGQRTEANRAIVPRKVRGHWLRARSRLDLSVALHIKRKNRNND